MAANDDIRQWSFSTFFNSPATNPTTTQPAAANVQWIVESCSAQMQSGTIGVYSVELAVLDGATVIASAIGVVSVTVAGEWETINLEIDGPIRCTPGNSMSILLSISGGPLANVLGAYAAQGYIA